jgi:hypothetical protein
MGLYVYNGSSWSSQATGLKLYNGSTWVNVTRGYVYNGSSWSQFYPEAPANTAAPTITLSSGGIYPAGINQTLTASTGTWTNNPTSYSYQWYAKGNGIGYSAISGATSSSFALSGTYAGATIKVTVTATNARGSTSVDSSEVGAFGPGALTGLTASRTGTGTAFVSWNASNGADRYYVQSSPPFASTTTTGTSITITGLTGPTAGIYVAAETTKWGYSMGLQGSGASTSVSGLP